MHNTHAERADHLCTCLPGGKNKTKKRTRTPYTHVNTHLQGTKKRIVIFTHRPPPLHTRALLFFPSDSSFFSSIIVVFHNHPETSGVWDELMVQMTGPRHAFKIVALGPKIGEKKKKKEISKVREKWSYQHEKSVLHQALVLVYLKKHLLYNSWIECVFKKLIPVHICLGFDTLAVFTVSTAKS